MEQTNKIAKIEIVFENVECAVVPVENIDNFVIDVIHHSVLLELSSRCNHKTLDRITRYNDIAWIEVVSNDGNRNIIHPLWLDSTVGGEENALQKSWIKNNGNLCVSIVEGKR